MCALAGRVAASVATLSPSSRIRSFARCAKGLLALAALLAGASAFAQSAAIASTNPSTLNQGNLRSAWIVVNLTGATYTAAAATSHFTLNTTISGLTVDSLWFNSGRTGVILYLRYDGSDFDAAATISVTVDAAATTHSAALTTGTVTVAPGRWVNVSRESVALTEGGGNGTYTAVLESPPTGDVTVTVTSDNAAVAVDSDATPLTRTLTFTMQNWNTAQTVTVAPVDDNSDAVDELALVAHAATGGGYMDTTAVVRVTVDDDEQTGTDYDADNDRLIEIDSLAKLNAVRWDLDGDGAASTGNETSYAAAFAGTVATEYMGCPDADADAAGDCAGYELTADLNFDTDGDGDVDADDPNSYASWIPIGKLPGDSNTDVRSYTTTFQGNGHTIANVRVNRPGDYYVGFFSRVGSGGRVTGLGLVNPDIYGNGDVHIGALAAINQGTIGACYVLGGRVRSAGPGSTDNMGGFVGHNNPGTIVNSYVSGTHLHAESAGTNAFMAGFVSDNDNGTIRASYAVATHSGPSGARRFHGVVSRSQQTVTDTYWDSTVASRIGNLYQVSYDGSQSTANLQAQLGYRGIYANWNNHDVDGDGAIDDVWDFGTAYNYPALKYGEFDPALQRTDYDADGDGLIDIATLGQLNAVRWDLDGDGAPSTGNETSFHAAGAFLNPSFQPGGAGLCPTTEVDADDDDCRGYELLNDLDFDTNGNGATWTAPGGTVTGDTGDAYDNAGAGWMSIGSTAANNAANYTATFDGNGHVIDNLFINRGTWQYQGLFAGTTASAVITSLGLPNIRIQAAQNLTGGLVGVHRGRIAAVWSSGTVRAGSAPGGLVGGTTTANARVVASYSAAAVECTSSAGNAVAGGLVGYHDGGTIAASYSTGRVTGACPAGSKGALTLVGNGTVAASYWDTTLSQIADDTEDPPQPPEGRTTAVLQAPTSYDTVVGDPGEAIYAAWDDQDVDGDGVSGEAEDDDPWDFGRSNQHPILKYRGLAPAQQLDAQPDTAPDFSGTVANMTLPGAVAVEFQVPAATGGNGAYRYEARGLPAGLSFGLPTCATERTVCGTPTAAYTGFAAITVNDGDSNMEATDRDTLTFLVTVPAASASIASTTPPALLETSLNGARVVVELAGTVFVGGVSPSSFQLATTPAIAGLSIASAVRDSATQATLTLRFDGMNFDTQATLLVRVLAAAHRFGGDQETGAVAVAPVRGMVLSATTLALAEDPGTSNANVGTYTAVLAGQPTGTVTVTVTSADPAAVTVDTAAATGLQSALSFTPTNWDTAQTVTLTAVQDVDSNSEVTAIDHAAQGGGYDGATARLVATVADDDVGVIVDTDPNTSGDQTTPLALNEGQTATYTVRLSTLPAGGNVTVAVASDNPAIDVAPGTSGGTFGSAASLTFTATDWAAAQTVRVLAEQDADAVGERGTISHDPDGAQYGSAATIDIAATAQDDEMDGADYDTDDDNLIEIDSLAKLNAVRWDLDGDGDVDSSANEAGYRSAFAGSIMAEDMGCLDGPDVDQEGDCAGYELMADLDFDTDDDGDVDADDPNSYANWMPIGTYTAAFEGNRRTISNLTTSGAGDRGLFAELGTGSSVSNLGLVDVAVSSTGIAGALAGVNRGTVVAVYASGAVSADGAASVRAGGLVGRHSGGDVKASYATAVVSASSNAFIYVGGLAGWSDAAIAASYAAGAVRASGTGNARIGGLVGRVDGTAAVVTNSYATGAVSSAATGSSPAIGGLVGAATGSAPAAAASYWDSQTTGQSSSAVGTTQTTSSLQTPTVYGTGMDIYAAWDDYDTNGDGTVDAADDAWDFGGAYNYPALKYGGLDPASQRNDYDADDDGLIEISTLQQLNALRWDVDGDGAPSSGNESNYHAVRAFFNPRLNPGGAGLCPTTAADADDDDCAGYELLNDLDFDTDGDGDVDGNDPNTYATWTPVPGWASTLDGGGHVIEHLTVSGAGNDRGLFATATTAATVRSLGLVDVSVTGTGVRLAALAGVFNGRIAAVYATGTVRGAGGVGGLVAEVRSASARIVASYSAADVECTANQNWARAGALVSRNDGVIAASYATGEITGNCPTEVRGGLASVNNGTAPASYWDTNLTGIDDDTDDPPQPPEGRTTAVLQAPTSYDTVVGDPGEAIYAMWDEQDVDGATGDGGDADPWDFGRPNQHPILKYAGLAAAPQLDAQPDTAPAFSGTVDDMTLPGNVAVSFQVPAATAGNGAYRYAASGLPAGLSFGLPDCADERTVCGTPTAASTGTVTVTVSDGDSNMEATDRDTLTFMATVPAASASIASTTPTALVETNLNGARVVVELAGTVFVGGLSPSGFQLATTPTIAGLSIDSAVRTSPTEATLTLRFDGTDFNTQATLLVRVLAAAHRFGGDQDTGAVAVAPAGGVMLSATTLALEEDPGSTNANVGTYTAVLAGQPAGAVTVTPASSNPDVTLSGALAFNATNWNTAQTVTATAGADDDAVDDVAHVTHAVQGVPGVTSGPRVRVTVNDKDAQGLTLDAATLAGSGVTEGMTATYTVRLASEPTGPVTVAVSSSEDAVTVDADAGAAGAQTTLLFHAVNWNAPQTVTVRAGEDDDGESETATLTHDPSGADYGDVEDVDVSFTVSDNDTKGATLSTATLNVQENGTATYTLVLDTQPVDGAVSAAVGIGSQTAATASPETLAFTAGNWNAPQMVTVTGVDDANTGNEIVAFTHTPTGGGYDGVSISNINVTAVDDDVAGLKVSPTSLTVAEGATATYTVRLNVAPTGTTTVTVGGATAKLAADTDTGTPGDQTMLSFDAANWDTAQTVTVTGAEDADGADETASLTHAVAGTGDYASLAAIRRPGVSVLVRDDETAGVVLAPTSLAIDEGGTATYDVELSAPPATGTATVTIAATGMAGLTVDASALSFTTTTWDTAQTVTVTAVADHAPAGGRPRDADPRRGRLRRGGVRPRPAGAGGEHHRGLRRRRRRADRDRQPGAAERDALGLGRRRRGVLGQRGVLRHGVPDPARRRRVPDGDLGDGLRRLRADRGPGLRHRRRRRHARGRRRRRRRRPRQRRRRLDAGRRRRGDAVRGAVRRQRAHPAQPVREPGRGQLPGPVRGRVGARRGGGPGERLGARRARRGGAGRLRHRRGAGDGRLEHGRRVGRRVGRRPGGADADRRAHRRELLDGGGGVPQLGERLRRRPGGRRQQRNDGGVDELVGRRGDRRLPGQGRPGRRARGGDGQLVGRRGVRHPRRRRPGLPGGPEHVGSPDADRLRGPLRELERGPRRRLRGGRSVALRQPAPVPVAEVGRLRPVAAVRGGRGAGAGADGGIERADRGSGGDDVPGPAGDVAGGGRGDGVPGAVAAVREGVVAAAAGGDDRDALRDRRACGGGLRGAGAGGGRRRGRRAVGAGAGRVGNAEPPADRARHRGRGHGRRAHGGGGLGRDLLGPGRRRPALRGVRRRRRRGGVGLRRRAAPARDAPGRSDGDGHGDRPGRAVGQRVVRGARRRGAVAARQSGGAGGRRGGAGCGTEPAAGHGRGGWLALGGGRRTGHG